MMKNVIYKYVCVALLGMAVFACAEDKGNYDYHDLTELEITGVDDNLSVLTYNRLQLTPDLGASALPDDQYDFEWKVITKDDVENEEETVIGNSRNLDYEVTLVADVYTLYFTVTEKATGVYWQKNYTLTVSDTTSEGWMVLCSDNGRARLDMISDVTGDTYSDLLKNYEIGQWQGPRRIQCLPSAMTDAQSPFYLLTDDGATRLGKNSFEWKEEYNLAYEAAVNGASLRPYSITYAGFGKLFVSGTEAYHCEMGMGIDGLYQSAVNKNFAVAPCIGTNVSASSIYAALYLLYDTTNRRFMSYCPMMAYSDFGNLDPLATMDEMEEIATSFKGNDGVVNTVSYDYPEGYDFVYMENTKYDPGNAKMGTTYTILSKDGGCYLYGIQLGDLLLYADCTFVLGKSYYGDLSGCTDILKEGTLYAFSSLKNYLYYAVGGTVYRVDLSASPLTAERQFSLGGETITCLKFNLYQNSSNASRSYDLVVGSVNGSGEGTLRVYEGRESEGDFRAVTPEKYTGFARIVDATYRERDN